MEYVGRNSSDFIFVIILVKEIGSKIENFCYYNSQKLMNILKYIFIFYIIFILCTKERRIFCTSPHLSVPLVTRGKAQKGNIKQDKPQLIIKIPTYSSKRQQNWTLFCRNHDDWMSVNMGVFSSPAVCKIQDFLNLASVCSG